MKNKLSRRIVIGTLALVLLCGSAVAASNIRTKNMEVNYMGIKLVVDGIEVTPKDANGTVVEPFVSAGTTYLPVRAVANALGKDVEWDGENMTVYIGRRPDLEENWMTKLPPYQLNNATAYDGSDHTKFFTVAGNNQPVGLTIRCSGDYYGRGPKGGDGAHGTVLWNTNCVYQTLNITVGHMGKQQVDCDLEVYLDGVYSQTITLPWSTAPQTLSIPLKYTPNVRLELVSGDENSDHSSSLYQYDVTSWYGIYDISFE